ncbi:MAG: methylmalonyl-CoA epimerase [Chloroflexota bacterium]
MIKRIDHLAIVVESIEGALGFWRDALGLPVTRTETNAREQVEIAFLPVGESEIELLEPTEADSGIGQHLAKRGAGMHHVCVEVDDIEAALARLTAHGVALINETPRVRDDGTRYAFVHPRSASGVLVELYEKPGAS